LKAVDEIDPIQLFLPTIFSAMHKLAWVFLGAKVAHRCRLPNEPKNSTYHKWEGKSEIRFFFMNDVSHNGLSLLTHFFIYFNRQIILKSFQFDLDFKILYEQFAWTLF
jgi:hypothetical protein